MIESTARVLKALGEPTRLKIVKFLSLQELCVCELEAILDISQPRVSQHIRVLKQAGIVEERKERQRSYYSLKPTVLDGATVQAFQALLELNLNKIPELEEESRRFFELNSNEMVQACKKGCAATSMKRIS
ncbi:MAG: ArsR/SmtB family transcription factor [Syntrophomonadaceae bacterium]|jgi:ArsR family transcriptional regulator